MEENEAGVRYEEGEALRAAAENQARRTLNTAEWDTVDPDRFFRTPHSAFEAQDRDELVARIRALPSRPKRSPEQRQREQALARRERTAVELKDFVEEQRLRVFGRRDPPFAEGARAAAVWVEEIAEEGPKTARLHVSIVVPVAAANVTGLWWLRDWLSDALPSDAPETAEQEGSELARIFGDPDYPLISVALERRLLPYLGIAPSGDLGIKRVPAADGSTLGDLLLAAEEIAEATGWGVLASVHHLLTGGLISVPVRATSSFRGSRQSSSQTEITLEIDNPAGTITAEVARSFREARKHTGPSAKRRQRGRPAPLNERLVAFVEEHGGTWPQKWRLWNETYPDDRLPSHDAMRRRYRRAIGPS